MKVRFPLSLKISLWLLLNLLVLAAVAAGLFVVQSGARWDSVVTGSSGRRITQLATVAIGEVAAAPVADRDQVLARFGTAYGVELFIFLNEGTRLAGRDTALPDAVLRRFNERPAGELRPEGRPPPALLLNLPPPRREDPPLQAPGDLAGRGRFLVRDSATGDWWIGLRLAFTEPGLRPRPATFFVRTSSLWGVASLLDLQTWIIVGAAVVVLSVLIWLPLVSGITRSLRGLTVATESIAEGRFDTRVGLRRNDELGRLGEAIDVMAGRLDTLVNGQKRFLGDVAHELGSPLGRMQVAIEILETRADPSLHAQIEDVREEVQQMSALVNELLAFTKAGLRARRADLAAVELAPLAARVLAREGAAGFVAVDLAAELTVSADAELLERALGNLIRNALRYAADAGPITLAAQADENEIMLTVADEGPGVPGEALARLGEPFYRPEAARTRETGGAGLGLAIVRSAVEACRGRVTFRNREPRGFAAEIRLARAPTIVT